MSLALYIGLSRGDLSDMTAAPSFSMIDGGTFINIGIYIDGYIYIG